MATMTFEQFQATRQRCEDLRAALQDEVFGAGVKGNLYLGRLYIEDTTGWPADGSGKGRWDLLIGRADWQTDDLESLERRLYAFAVDEGYLD